MADGDDRVWEGLDHVQIAVPVAGEPRAREFFAGVLGLREVPKPAVMAARGGCWFQCGAQQIHVGVEKDFVPAKKAHPALRLRDAAAARAVAELLSSAGYPVQWSDEIPALKRFFSEDPFGNRVEFVAPAE